MIGLLKKGNLLLLVLLITGCSALNRVEGVLTDRSIAEHLSEQETYKIQTLDGKQHLIYVTFIKEKEVVGVLESGKSKSIEYVNIATFERLEFSLLETVGQAAFWESVSILIFGALFYITWVGF